MFVDQEQARYLARKHAAENWTCFFCFSLEKIENDSCQKCGQTKNATDKSKKQQEREQEMKVKEKERKELAKKKKEEEEEDEEDDEEDDEGGGDAEQKDATKDK